jgi:hypothetical protein
LKIKEGGVIQIAYVVRDLETAMKRHVEVGVGPWHIYKFEPGKIQNYIYRGKPATHTCWIAVTPMELGSLGCQVELMQPISGRSIYDEHLEKHGESFHHVKLYYPDCAKAVAEYAKRGYPVLQQGKIDDDEHYYLDTVKDFGYMIELGNAGRIRAPERVYPS